MANSKVGRRQELTTEILSEVSEFTWTIKNFKAVLANKTSEHLKWDVEAGHTIELPTQWRFFFKIKSNFIMIYLSLMKSPEEREAVFARFDLEIIDKFRAGNCWNYKLSSLKHDFPSAFQFLKKPTSLDKLVDGHLTLHCKLTMFNSLQITSEETSYPKMEDPSLPPILKGLSKLLESGVNADIKLQTNDGKELKAHRAILSSQSPVFFPMFQNQMTECTTGVVCINDFSSQAMTIILKHIYTGTVDANWGDYFEEVIDAAEKYSLTLLKDHCDRTLVKICTPENVWITLKKAQQFGLKQAEKKIKEYIERNIRAILETDKLED